MKRYVMALVAVIVLLMIEIMAIMTIYSQESTKYTTIETNTPQEIVITNDR